MNEINKAKGEIGVDFFKELIDSIPEYACVKCTREEDMQDGTDCFIVNKDSQNIVAKIDVKNTTLLYFLTVDKDKKIILRHPWKSNTKSTHEAIVSVIDTKQTLLALYNHDEWLSQFVKKDKLEAFKKRVLSFEFKTIDDALLSINGFKSMEQACLMLKKELQPYLIGSADISYTEPMDALMKGEKISFNLFRRQTDPIVFPKTTIDKEFLDNLNSIKIEKEVVQSSLTLQDRFAKEKRTSVIK